MKRLSPLRAILLATALVVALAALPGATAAMSASAPPAAAGPASSPGAAEMPDIVDSDGVADTSESVETTIGPNETVDDDVTAMTGDVVVRGTVDGDVTSVSGSVRVTGTVTGDVSAAAGSVTVGPGGTIDGDVSSGGGSVELGAGATVGQDVSAGAGSVIVPAGALVEGDVAAGGGDADVNGTVEGDVASGESVILGSSAVVEGSVTYRESFDRADGARVDGTITERSENWQPSGPEIQIEPGVPIVSFVPGFVPSGLVPVYWTVIALFIGGALLGLFPRFSTAVATRASEDPIRSIGTGIVALVAVPLALVTFLLTVVGIPVALAGGAVFALALWASLVYGEYLVGRQILGAAGWPNRWAALVLGVVAIEALSLVPLLGSLLELVVLVVGLGAVALAAADRWRGESGGTEPEPVDSEPAPPAA
jgi:cytoskeletal protein CcmA (bactofilin family)